MRPFLLPRNPPGELGYVAVICTPFPLFLNPPSQHWVDLWLSGKPLILIETLETSSRDRKQTTQKSSVRKKDKNSQKMMRYIGCRLSSSTWWAFHSPTECLSVWTKGHMDIILLLLFSINILCTGWKFPKLTFYSQNLKHPLNMFKLLWMFPRHFNIINFMGQYLIWFFKPLMLLSKYMYCWINSFTELGAWYHLLILKLSFQKSL